MDDDEYESGKRKRRERYVRKACAECKRRKIKCDGDLPCAHCHSINCTCEYFEGKARGGARRPGKTSEVSQEEYGDDVLARLRAVEARLDLYALQYPLSAGTPGRPGKSDTSPAPFRMPLVPGVPSNGHAKSISWEHASGSSDVDDNGRVDRGSLSRSGLSSVFYGQSSSAGNLSNLRSQLHSFAAADGLDTEGIKSDSMALSSRAGQSGVITPAEALLPHFTLPSKSRTFVLLHEMFDNLNSMYPLLHPPTFYKRFEALWDHNGVYLADLAESDKYSRTEIGLLLACLAATSNMTARPGKIESQSAARETQEWFLAAKTLVYDRTLDVVTDLESIQAMVMLSLYYLHAENEDAAYKLIGLAIRSAHEIGLHLASRERDLSSADIEFRRRTWWCLYLVDRRTSIQVGRPFCIQDHESDVQFPTPLDDLHEFPQQLDAPIRLEASKIPYLMQFVGFSSICGEIYSSFYGVKCRWPPDERFVMDLDSKLEQWRFALPAFLRFDQANLNSIPAWLAKQQLFLHLRGAHVRLLLLRPFVSEPEAIAQSHHTMAESALRLSSDIIHTISIVKRTSDLVERLWYPSKQIILTCIGIIFWVVLNFPTKFSASSSKADLRVALQLLKEFSEKSSAPASRASLRDVQFLRYLCNQALKSRNQRPLESAAQSPYHEPATTFDSTTAQNALEGDSFLYDGGQGDLSFLGGTPDMAQDNLLLGLLDSGDAGILPTSEQFLMMGEDYSRHTMLSL